MLDGHDPARGLERGDEPRVDPFVIEGDDIAAPANRTIAVEVARVADLEAVAATQAGSLRSAARTFTSTASEIAAWVVMRASWPAPMIPTIGAVTRSPG